MRRLASILFLLMALRAPAQIPITNHTILVNFDDSKSIGIYGQRLSFFRFSHYILMYPQWVISPREHSRSGGSTWEMLTNRVQSGGTPDWFAGRGLTNVIAFITASDNDTTSSNVWFTNFVDLVRAPTLTYDLHANFTNDWPFTTNLFTRVLFEDGPAQSADAGAGIGLANFAVSNVAVANGLKFVPSWHNVAPIEVAIYATNQPYGWFTNSGHPDNIIQFAEFLMDNQSLGEDSNAFTAVLDWNNTAGPSQTNHCTVPSISYSSGIFTFTFHADRMGAAYYTIDASQTNDCTPTFGLVPGASNIVCEIIRVTNCPAGNYNVIEDGVTIYPSVSSTRLSGGLNLFPDVHTGALWAQKKQCLKLLCNYAHVNPTNASDALPFNALWTDYGSFQAPRWQTNNLILPVGGMTGYTALMQDKESDLFAEDQILHANAQQTNHTFQIVPVTSGGGNATLNVGTLNIGG